MSQHNVELLRHVVEAFLDEGGESDWEPWLAKLGEIVHPAIEWDASEVPMPDLAGVYHGREAVIQWWREWLAAWETSEFDYRLVEAGERVVLLLDQTMRGRYTGIEVPVGKYAHVADFDQGLMVRWKVYARQRTALEAAGLKG
jgi:hypothetical protein